MAAYEGLAGLYDLLMDDVDYDAWADYYCELIGFSGKGTMSVCDCACGTGSISVRLAARGCRVTGVDVSGEMLERAQQKARSFGVQAMFVRQDMCALQLPRPVDAVICACDGVNYLLDDERVRTFFDSVHAALKPGGAFAFDISSAHKLENTLGDGFFGEDRGDVAYLWSNSFDAVARTVAMDLTFFVDAGNGLYRRFDETHLQRAHEAGRLEALLEQSGFERVRVYGERTKLPPLPDAQRIHFAAVRAE